MKKNITIFILILQSLLFCQETFYDEIADRQILTEKDLKASGVGILADIFQLADKWFSTSIDRVNWQASANSLSTFKRQNYIVLLDGQRFDLNMFDNQNINLLPISISQIDYVEFINSPQILDGEFTESGLIHFHTKIPVQKLSAGFSQYLGNETGDPGPFKFSEFSTPNIDKLNFNPAVIVNYGSKNWFLSGSVKLEENYATSELIIDRIANLSMANEKVNMTSVFAKLSVNAFNTSNQLLAGYSSQNDFFFFSPYGNEIPVKRQIQHVGLNGNAQLQKNISISYYAGFQNNGLSKWTNRKNINFDLLLQNYLIKLEGTYSSKFINSTFGISYDEFDALTTAKIDNKYITFKKVYLNNFIPVSKRYVQQAGVYLIKYKDKYSVKAILANSFKLNSCQTIKSSFTLSDRFYLEDLNYLTWQQQGYSIPLTESISTNIIGDLGSSRTFTADIYYIFKPDSIISIDLNGGYRQISSMYLEKQNYQYIPELHSFSSKYDIYADNEGKIVSCNVGLKLEIIPNLEQRFHYSFQKDIEGTELLRQTWKIFPRHKFGWIITYLPFNDFGISADLRYTSATDWTDYQYALIQTDSLYNENIKPKIIFDMAFQKWFLNKTIWTSVTFKNIFNQKEYYNPIGANANLRFYFQVHIYLDSLPE